MDSSRINGEVRVFLQPISTTATVDKTYKYGMNQVTSLGIQSKLFSTGEAYPAQKNSHPLFQRVKNIFTKTQPQEKRDYFEFITESAARRFASRVNAGKEYEAVIQKS